MVNPGNSAQNVSINIFFVKKQYQLGWSRVDKGWLAETFQSEGERHPGTHAQESVLQVNAQFMAKKMFKHFSQKNG